MIHRVLQLLSTLLLMFLLSLVPFSAGAQDSASPAAAESEVVFFAGPAGGQDGARFEVAIEPGSTATLELEVGNHGSQPLSLLTYTADAFTQVNGGIGILEQSTPQHEPTTWMTFPDETFDLEPDASAIKSFTITVPEGTTAGQYVNGLVVRTAESHEIVGSSTLRQIIQKYLAVYITVPGDLQANYVVGEPEFAVVDTLPLLSIPLENTGNIRVAPEGTMVLYGEDNQVLMTVPVLMGSVYAGDSTLIQVAMSEVPPPGSYAVSLEIVDPDSGITASLDQAPLIIDASEVAEPDVIPVTISEASVTPNGEPAQFADVAVTVQNIAGTVSGATLYLDVTHNGVAVEAFQIAQNTTIESGETSFTTRYIPATGFETGTWSFSLRLEATDPSGVTSVIATAPDVATIEIP